MKKIGIEFDFKGRHHNATVRLVEKGGKHEYHITVLDWELERILYGNEVIGNADGSLQANLLPGKSEQNELKLAIATALSRYLKIPCFVGDQCVSPVSSDSGWEHLHPIPHHHPHPPHGYAE
ncbi:MAG: hypothetical protein P4L51_26885 [Puia sp.]|nr:hypothetical protein [Puia sp.]